MPFPGRRGGMAWSGALAWCGSVRSAGGHRHAAARDAALLTFSALDEEWADAGRPARARLAADAAGADSEGVNALAVVLAPFAGQRVGDRADGTTRDRDPADAVEAGAEVRARRP